MDDFSSLVSAVGFPIVAWFCIYFRLEKKIDELKDNMDRLIEAILKKEVLGAFTDHD
jgi:hypothetical protein